MGGTRNILRLSSMFRSDEGDAAEESSLSIFLKHDWIATMLGYKSTRNSPCNVRSCAAAILWRCLTSTFSSVLVFDEALRRLQIRNHHFLHEGIKVDISLPSKDTLGLGRIAEEKAVYKHKCSQKEAR